MHYGPKIERAEERLGEDLGAWVNRHRADDRSWRWIADRLTKVTGVTVTPQRLGQVYGPSAAKSA